LADNGPVNIFLRVKPFSEFHINNLQ
jgi:hypothetical protein